MVIVWRFHVDEGIAARSRGGGHDFAGAWCGYRCAEPSTLFTDMTLLPVQKGRVTLYVLWYVVFCVQNGDSALMLAAGSGHQAVVDVLINHKALVNLQNSVRQLLSRLSLLRLSVSFLHSHVLRRKDTPR